MPLSQHAIDELKRIHQEESGEELTDDEAREMGRRLLVVYGILLRVPREKLGPYWD